MSWTFTGHVQTASRLRSASGNPRLLLDIRPSEGAGSDVRYLTAKDSQCGYGTIHFDRLMTFTVNADNEITSMGVAE